MLVAGGKRYTKGTVSERIPATNIQRARDSTRGFSWRFTEAFPAEPSAADKGDEDPVDPYPDAARPDY
jgi:hypothetical protein